MESDKKDLLRIEFCELDSDKFKNVLEQILVNNPIVLQTNPVEGKYILSGIIKSNGEVLYSSDKDVHFEVEARYAPLQYTPLDCWLAYNVTEGRKQIIVPIAPLGADKIIELLVSPLMPPLPNGPSYDTLKSLVEGIADEIRRVCTWQTPLERAFLFGEDQAGSEHDTESLAGPEHDTESLDEDEDYRVPNLRW